MPVGLGAMTADRIKALRQALNGREPFGTALAAYDLHLSIADLVPFARWCPSHAPARIFDARFYIAEVPRHAPDPIVDDTENVRVFWATARDVLERADAGKATLIFPTRRNLERLAQFGSFEAAAADAANHPIRTITPWTEHRAGVPHLCIPDDLGYPVTAVPMTDAIRG